MRINFISEKISKPLLPLMIATTVLGPTTLKAHNNNLEKSPTVETLEKNIVDQNRTTDSLKIKAVKLVDDKLGKTNKIVEAKQPKNVSELSKAEPEQLTEDPNPPTKIEIPPFDNSIKMFRQRPDLANKLIEQVDGTAIKYNQKGYFQKLFDEKGNIIKTASYKSDGTVNRYDTYEYDENDNMIKWVGYNPDGTFSLCYTYEYNEKGRPTRWVRYKTDGNVDGYNTYEYNENGHQTKTIFYNPDGTVNRYNAYECDENGKIIKQVRYNVDGTVQKD